MSVQAPLPNFCSAVAPQHCRKKAHNAEKKRPRTSLFLFCALLCLFAAPSALCPPHPRNPLFLPFPSWNWPRPRLEMDMCSQSRNQAGDWRPWDRKETTTLRVLSLRRPETVQLGPCDPQSLTHPNGGIMSPKTRFATLSPNTRSPRIQPFCRSTTPRTKRKTMPLLPPTTSSFGCVDRVVSPRRPAECATSAAVMWDPRFARNTAKSSRLMLGQKNGFVGGVSDADFASRSSQLWSVERPRGQSLHSTWIGGQSPPDERTAGAPRASTRRATAVHEGGD
jgi:hypothetical protein